MYRKMKMGKMILRTMPPSMRKYDNHVLINYGLLTKILFQSNGNGENFVEDTVTQDEDNQGVPYSCTYYIMLLTITLIMFRRIEMRKMIWKTLSPKKMKYVNYGVRNY